jgi:zinc-ribbon domain
MFCPKCATNNLDGARFCRSCGADISLVPQALAGHLPVEQNVATQEYSRRGRRRRREPSVDKAIKNIFSGIAFLIISIVLSFTPMGRFWWYWMLIPAFSMLGGGVAEWMRVKQTQPRTLASGSMPQALGAPPPLPRAGDFPVRNTSELVMPPPSVTEGTTRLLEDEAPTRHIGRAVENPVSKEKP